MNSWLAIAAVQNKQQVGEFCRTRLLDPGEAEAIVLAQEIGAGKILLDDQRAVACARELGLAVTRTPLIYSEARLRGWIRVYAQSWTTCARRDSG